MSTEIHGFTVTDTTVSKGTYSAPLADILLRQIGPRDVKYVTCSDNPDNQMLVDGRAVAAIRDWKEKQGGY